MSRNRFELLLRCWHFSDTLYQRVSGTDRLIRGGRVMTPPLGRLCLTVVVEFEPVLAEPRPRDPPSTHTGSALA
ncbi:hypothetical protein EVAR_19349_1 [Eumeta japonica]|uniref:Uncharacterized protein n=1 Tax=Eumeta variegata TaxID=151549 RepID=A0A4C1TRF3_EUMVA|nr:hypothetical protein EVAR_19349_1 [Eumeta japonica]